MERYRAFLPVTDATPPLTLGEGGTPLVHAARLGAAIGVPNLHLKVEGQNPTGSFKDRGMVVAVAKAAEAGARAIVCASTGNTSASAAAYGAAAGMDVIVVLPRGQIAKGKLLQALMAGARVVAIDGNFDQALAIVRALAEQDDHPVTLVNSVNPFRLDGQQTGGLRGLRPAGARAGHPGDPRRERREHQRVLGGVPGVRGGRTHRRGTPRMWGFQAAGAAPLVSGVRVEHPETVATAIRIGDPASWTLAIEARDASGGRIDAVTDDEILAAYRDLARPKASSASRRRRRPWPGCARRPPPARSTRDALVVCVLTGHGLKDPTTAEREAGAVHRSRADRRLGRRRAGLVGGWSRTGSPSSMAARSPSRCPRRRPTSGPGTTASASRSR